MKHFNVRSKFVIPRERYNITVDVVRDRDKSYFCTVITTRHVDNPHDLSVLQNDKKKPSGGGGRSPRQIRCWRTHEKSLGRVTCSTARLNVRR